MKKTNKLISILIAVAMLLSMAPVTVFAASVVASGKFGASGNNLTWSLDSDGVLTISGNGEMEDFANVSKVPWYSKRTNVKTVVIESGVTNIGKDAFYGITSLVNATISDTVTSIGNRAFSGSGLINFEFSDAGNLKTIENAAFSNTQIKSMVIPDGVTTLGSYVFGYGPIKSVTIPASVTSVGNFFFEETSSLSEVIFLGNKEPETIGNTVFLGCSSLAYVSVPADYEGDTFSNMKVSKAAASVAEVNGQGFATLADAISEAQSISGAELKLLSHISIDSGITIESGKFTIDLNGKELFSNGYFLLRIDGADVTIVDSAVGGVFNATNDQGNIVLEVLSGSANISGGTFNSAGYPATVRDGTLKLTGKDFVLNGNWRIGWYGGSVDLSACTADEVRIQACADGLQASAVTLPDGWGLFKNNGTPCTEFVKNDIYVAKAGFKVTASVNPAEGGTVKGAGTYSSGATVTLTATAANGYRFINWIENGEEVSTSAVYTFTASKNRELTANFEIVPHTHSFTYTAGGSRIVATCVAGDCPLENGIGGMLTISAPADLYVDGETAKEAVIDNQLVEAVDYTVTYSTADGSAPKTAGTYTASVTVGGATATVEFTLLNYAAMVTDKDGYELSGSPYKTLADAITAASASEGSTVTLLDDITLTKQQVIRSGKLTLDLNGNNLVNETDSVFYIYEEVDLTIKDNGEGGTVETKRLYVDCIDNSGKLTVESGIIKGDGGIRNFGVLYFNDGTVEADNYPAIANYNDSTVYVYDGVLKGGKNSGAVENGGTLYVYGGEIESIVNVNDAYISGGKIDRDDYVALNLLGGTVEITGGSFTGTDNEYGRHSGTPYGEWTVDIDEGATLILKGGEFPNGFVTDETTVNALLAEGYAFYDKDGNKITVADDATKIDGYVQVKEYFAASVTDKDGYELSGSPYKTLADAIAVAQGSEGSTLTLLDDYNGNSYVNITSGTFTIDLAGKTVTSSGWNTAVMVNGSDVNLTITDSIGGGKIYDSSMSLNISAAQCVTIDNGIFERYLNLTKGNLVINGGTFYKGTARYSIGDDDGTNVAIYGGEFPDGFYAYLKSPNDYLADGCYFRDAENRIITVADGATTIIGYVKVEKGAYITDGVITLDSTEFTYNGSEIKPTVIVTVGGKTLTEGKDYTLTFANNVNAGTATVTVKGAGDYSGEATKVFTIVKADNTVTAAPTPNTLTYNGEAHNLISAGEASFGTMVYSLDGTEYSETIPQGTDAGNYTVYYKVIGDSNHNDTEPATVTVTINAKDISDGFIILGAPLTYNGKEQTQTVEKVIPTGTAPEATYTVSGNKATNVGVYLLTVTGTGNFTGEAKIAYEIAVDKSGIEGLTIDYVKSTDKEKVEYVYNQLENAVKDLADEDKISEWNTLQAYCAAMRQRIYIIENLIEAFENKSGEYDINTVTSDDAAYLESFQNSVGKFYNDYYDNLTDEQEKKITDIYSAIEDLETRISDVAEEITRITNAVNGYDEATVKYSDYKDILQLIDDIEALTDGQNITADERASLEELNTKANLLAAKIRSTADEIARITRAVNAYSIDTVKSSDKADIENLIERIKKLTDGDNITADERANLNELDSTLDALLAKIDETADELARLEAEVGKYDEATVKSSDLDALNKLDSEIYALALTDNVTAEEKTKLNELHDKVFALITKVGNVSEEIVRIVDVIDAYVFESVKSSDKADIVKLIADIKALIDGDNITEDERAVLVKADQTADALLEKIAATAEEIKRIDNATNAYDISTVTSADKADIEKLLADSKALQDGDNITEAEEAALVENDATLNALLDRIAATTKEIERIDEAVNGYDEETVKSSDEDAINQLKEDIKALTDGDNLTDDERTALEEADKAIDELVEKLAEVAEEIKKVDVAVKSYDEETVKSTDKEDLAQLKEDIQNLIDSGNTTENEKTALEEMIEKVEGLEDKIEEIETQLERIEGIENVYNPETVTSDDKSAIENAIDEIEAVNPDNLTDEQREEYEEIKAGLEALLDEIAAAEKAVADIGAQLEMFGEERVTIFWEDDIEALKTKIDEILADENMGETEKAKLNEYKAQCDKLIEIINTPVEYFSLRLFYLIWDLILWIWNSVVNAFSGLFGIQAIA
ncbi:MAG: leucine-rich repeat protein [Clostridia bacterium]|nr:leucine-rich repeat protein [Clostridia bacterium]